ncbi:MAG: phasin family protein [Silicimonas sp.]|jgi:hypothetical protein|nr:phasin family protein [Silicimonas sp.]
MPEKEKTEGTQAKRAMMGDGQVPDIAALQLLGFNTMTSFGTAWMETLGNMGSEMLSFVADRIKEDVKTQHRCLHCDDMAKLQEIQAEFFRKAIEQYTAESGKLVEMSQNLFPSVGDNGKH